jgi:hypothetical protein
MKFLRFSSLLIFLLLASALAQTGWKTAEAFQFDWDGHPNVRVTLELPMMWEGRGEFSRVRIQVPGRKEFVVQREVGWVHFRSEDAALADDYAKSAKNTLQSKNILAIRIWKMRTVLLLFGSAYGSSPGGLDVLEISSDGQPQVVLRKKELGLRDMRDLDGDGIAELIGYPCLSQEFGNNLQTYDPYNIYKLGVDAGTPARLSLPLSKSYNLKHYYGWAGPRCSEDFAVVLSPPGGGRPQVMRTKDAEKLTGGGGR